MKIIRIVVIISDCRYQIKIIRIVGLDASKIFEDISDSSDSSAISDIRYQLRIIRIVVIISDCRYQIKIIRIVGLDASKLVKIYRILKIIVQYLILVMS